MDVDIDLKTNFDPLELFDTAIRASRVQNGELKKHNAGVYFQDIPKDKITGLAAIPYKEAQELGYFKIDFLHLSLLDNFERKEEIKTLVEKEPNWGLLKQKEVVAKLFQLSKHYDLVNKVKPKSVNDLADCIALIRPGKKHLINQYLNNKEQTRKVLYVKPTDGSAYYKKSHAVAYALTIVLQLHLIENDIL